MDRSTTQWSVSDCRSEMCQGRTRYVSGESKSRRNEAVKENTLQVRTDVGPQVVAKVQTNR